MNSRECFVPRPGYVYGFADYSGLELCTLAQVCLDIFGYSKMAEAINSGKDLHLLLGASLLERSSGQTVSYDEAKRRLKAGDAEIKHYRQQAKPANFGFPGGMGAESFVEYSANYGIILTLEQSKSLRDAWFQMWPEMRDYFPWITQLTEGDAPVQQIRSGRLRGGASFCAAANGMFQGLAADGAKEALWLVSKECYLDKSSPLYGCRPVLFIHDEIGIEIPFDETHPEKASAAAERLSAVMVAAMKRWVPDVLIKAEPVIVRRWFKGAEIVRRADGMILPSKPVVIEKDGKKRTEWVADMSTAA